MNGRLLRWLMSLRAAREWIVDGGPRLTILRHHRVFENGARRSIGWV
jgi:hypothetical protein